VSNASRWYATREAVKAAVGITGGKADALIDSYIETASEALEKLLSGRRFIPQTETRYYPWPQKAGKSTVLYLDQDLLAVTTLQAKAQDASPTTIAAADYFLEPVNEPPYRRIEIDLSSSAAFEAGDTSQRSISVLGRWAYSEATKAAGALAEADDGTETALNVTDSSLIDVGDTILIGTEAMFVSARAQLTTGTTLNDTLAASQSDVTVTLASGAAAKQGEVLLLDSEKMLVEAISGNDLTVQRGYDGSVLAAHSSGITVYAPRTLTVVRAVNGTSAATHADAAAILKYAPPADIVNYVQGLAILSHKQASSGWTGQIGGPEGAVQVRPFDIAKLEEKIIANYRLVTF